MVRQLLKEEHAGVVGIEFIIVLICLCVVVFGAVNTKFPIGDPNGQTVVERISNNVKMIEDYITNNNGSTGIGGFGDNSDANTRTGDIWFDLG